MYFHKTKFILPSYTTTRLLSCKGVTTTHGKYKDIDSLSLLTIPRNRSVTILKSCLPEELCYHIKGVAISSVNNIAAHKHLLDNCVLNFYLSCNKEFTTFWSGEEKIDNELVTDNGNGYYMMNMSCLQPVKAFNAKPNESYLLDTLKIHSVSPIEIHSKNKPNSAVEFYETFIKNKSNSSRKVVQVFFNDNLYYEDIAEIIENSY